ncbi:hypothetical protein BD770DRAFT_416764 [Pilaira anomala]|nr:hypothetical protein BD770DRAFT_416764 [Pilaira anomala]
MIVSIRIYVVMLSVSFPNLKYLRYLRDNNKIFDVGVFFRITNARLDMIVCKDLPFYYGAQESFDFYVRLEMETGSKFYEHNSQTSVIAIDEQQHNQSETKFRLEITCLVLAKLCIRSLALMKKKYIFVVKIRHTMHLVCIFMSKVYDTFLNNNMYKSSKIMDIYDINAESASGGGGENTIRVLFIVSSEPFQIQVTQNQILFNAVAIF